MFEIHREIIIQAQEGKQEAFKKLYLLYSKAMFNSSLRMLGDEEEAKDCLQESFTNAFINISSFDFRVSFGAWLKRIVLNNSINMLKSKKAEFEFFDITDYDAPEENHESDEPAYTVEAITKAMLQLPKGSQSVFSLYLLEGYDHEEIAEILGITASTSKSQLMKAKTRVKNIILHNENER